MNHNKKILKQVFPICISDFFLFYLLRKETVLASPCIQQCHQNLCFIANLLVLKTMFQMSPWGVEEDRYTVYLYPVSEF